MRRRQRWVSGFSLNKGLSFFPLEACCVGTLPSLASSSAKPPRWWYGEDAEAGVAFFNKWRLPWCCSCMLWSSFPLTGHGGKEGGGKLRATYGSGGGRGNLEVELIHADGNFAVAIYSRNGGVISTSGAEDWSRSRHGSSKSSHREVMCSPQRLGGPWVRHVVGRGLPSCWPLLLGSNASRMPARGGGGALGLDCKVTFSFRVLFIKKSALSTDR
jgi:hypothetical protein